ncbi:MULTISPECIES: DUF4352 domain-containing protein [Bacillus]|uniref:DUF4352 domain-containing protein n=1 Tax=Bacillus cereus TaxID=1396 RepID=A0A2C1LWH6_BACCE|nr:MULTISPECIES: DUF4352 domain-containing protein [Bacillus]MDH4424710.1 DUF4352 domain-containing protein [Bacillus cereus]PGL82363.1 DUF4352 domain-containing protein [Bacillus sp. AFS054943]PGU02803.1 DUF4352 domain-containing protein [Bacillus cereus]PGX16224.1 DUF4352 domain-containing protein [Bacillus sp. AFS033286]PGZ67151.1 DUF4352 domain-containing protein [Bacillus sp. AFS029637]
MRKLSILLTLSLVFVSVMGACTQDKKDNAVENNSIEEPTAKNENEELINFEEKENISRLEQGILLVGESAKGGYYLTTVQSAYLNDNNDSIVVNVSVKNVRGQMIGLSELKYTLKDEKNGKTYEGKLLDQNPSDIQVKPNETVELKIAFEVPGTADEYMFYIESSLDSLGTTHWKIDKLQSPKN